MSKKTVATFLEMKHTGEKITMLTAYDYSMAKILDQAGVDSILVGDSLGMTMLGYEDTLAVTMEDMIHHTKAVKRGVSNAMVICDMPFMSYHISAEEAVRNAGRIIKETGAHAVKVEGGKTVERQIKAIVTPQSVNMMGGFLVQGKSEEQAVKLIEEAKLLESLGCFSIVLECIPEKLAKIISDQLTIPTIGIGAGAGCDGQVLVIQDMLGLYDNFRPKFVKAYAEMSTTIAEAVSNYCKEVKSATFPELKHTFKISDDILDKLY